MMRENTGVSPGIPLQWTLVGDGFLAARPAIYAKTKLAKPESVEENA
jgi:hypothetical protein